jgi:hypothetical protein
MVASLGVIGALRFVRYTQANPPIARANVLATFLGGRMATYGAVGLFASALTIQDKPGHTLNWGSIVSDIG